MRVIIGFVCLFLGALMLMFPNMTRRGILFAVPVDVSLRESPVGRRSIWTFRALVSLTLVLTLYAIALCPESVFGMVATVAPLVVLFAGGAGFFWQKRKLQPFAIEPAEPRQADLSEAPDKLPWFTWLALGPFLLIATAAAFLHENRERIPHRFPIHWGVNGQPNGWSDRSIRGVYGPLLFASTLCLSLLILLLAMWFGSRRSYLRRIILGVNLATEYLLAFVFTTTSLNPVVHIPLWITAIGPIIAVMLMLILAIRKIGDASEPAEPTPNDCWRGGLIYYNPSDAALFVEKRTGLGYTFNFGNRWSWAVVAGLLLAVCSSLLLL